MPDYYIYSLGFVAQALFSARLLIQWWRSEKAGKVISPTIFWQLSVFASFLLIVYGMLRNDFVIIGGQVIGYFIYIRNLRFKQAWSYIPLWFRILTLSFPVIAFAWLWWGDIHSFQYIVENNDIPTGLFVWGSAAQIIFVLRFVYQWIISERMNKSVLPLGFWIISASGSAMIITYAIFRSDPVLFLGHIFGLAIYLRNIFLIAKSVKELKITNQISKNS
ncbi:MAG: lipid-A-disaccharide synthase N-terminal domain-containing protein [Bacteroidetes bacterium]|nr:lipid-A-disaccharide synthase N-terminal domain-containing protein [Bacteroidota bacterium]